MTSDDREALDTLARRVREHVVRLTARGGCFAGAALSCVDILTVLYGRVLRVDPARPDAPDRDVFLLSKGHAVPALYGTLVELGFFPAERLENHLSARDAVYWHPNRALPGVEFHSGSLGHLLAVGAGIALDMRLRGSAARVVVMLGDGELNEGSVWEAALVAAAHRLDNLLVVVDRNALQANAATESLVPLEPLPAKFEAFGWCTVDVDGHDLVALDRAFSAPRLPGIPQAVIAHTVRGKGVPSIEGRADGWFCDFSAEQADAMLHELAWNRATEPSEPAAPLIRPMSAGAVTE